MPMNELTSGGDLRELVNELMRRKFALFADGGRTHVWKSFTSISLELKLAVNESRQVISIAK